MALVHGESSAWRSRSVLGMLQYRGHSAAQAVRGALRHNHSEYERTRALGGWPEGESEPVRVYVVLKNDSLQEFVVCKECEGVVDLYSRLVHLKVNYFKLCALKVQETQNANPELETSELLQAVLNTDWIEKVT